MDVTESQGGLAEQCLQCVDPEEIYGYNMKDDSFNWCTHNVPNIPEFIWVR